MAKSREIKRRIKAVGNIRRITKTMQMIATARFQAAQRRATASKPYSQKIAEMVGELSQSALSQGGGLAHPLLKSSSQPTNRQLLLIITSNRGLCGGYNANILRTAVAYLREHPSVEFDLEVVGKKGLGYFKFMRRKVSEFHGQFTDKPSFDEVKKLAERYMSAFSSGQYESVSVIYMSFISMARQTPQVLRLLPLESPAGGDAANTGTPKAGLPPGSEDASRNSNFGVSGEYGQRSQPSGKKTATVSTEYEFTPDAMTLLNELLPITVETQLFQCFNEAVVGEQIARMVAMKSATDSAGKMGKELSRRYNRARQAAITTELSEIIAGAASLE